MMSHKLIDGRQNNIGVLSRAEINHGALTSRALQGNTYLAQEKGQNEKGRPTGFPVPSLSPRFACL